MKRRVLAIVGLLGLMAALAVSIATAAAAANAGFDDHFTSATLGPEWLISPGEGNYSLTDNPGYLRYIIDAYHTARIEGSGQGYAQSLWLVRRFSGDQWVLTTAITYNMRPGSPTNNRNMHFLIRTPGNGWNFTTIAYIGRSVGIYDDNLGGSNSISLCAGNSSTPIYFPNSPNPLPLERWYFEIERSKDHVALRASNDGSDSTFEYEVEHTFPSGVLGNNQVIEIDGDGWYGSNDPQGYADFDFIAVTTNSELEEGLCSLIISSTTGGAVTSLGKGIFFYDEGTVVDLVAEPEEGCRFVNWTGDVSIIADVTAASTSITMEGDYSITANFGYGVIKSGDWIKFKYAISGWPAGQLSPEWLKLEFLSVEGTSANVRATLHMCDGTEQSDTVPTDLAAGGGEAFGLSGFVIPSNLTTGDSVYMSGFGDVTIKGQTTRAYAGARRTVVYASTSQSIPYQGEVKLTYYWDKLTGVMVEGSTTNGGMTATGKLTETNMWEAAPPPVWMQWWLWAIVAVGYVALVLVVYRSEKRKTATTPTPPRDGT